MTTYPHRLPIEQEKEPSAPTCKKVYVIIVDFEPKEDFKKIVKRKTSQKICMFDYQEFHNKTFAYLTEENENKCFLFNISDSDCREWVSVHLRELKEHNIIAVCNNMNQAWIKTIEPNIICKKKKFNKIILSCNPNELYNIRIDIPKPRSILYRIFATLIGCFREKRENINC